MENIVSQLTSASNGFEPSASFNVVIVYEDFESGKNAKRTYDYLAAKLGAECEFKNQMWKYDILTLPKLREIALQDALEADVLLLSSRGGSTPVQVKNWLEEWSIQNRRTVALVARWEVYD
jgi:hypothetical protein